MLVGGRMAGVWEHEARRGTTTVTVTMFEPAAPGVREAVEAEALRLGPELGMPVEVAWARGPTA